MSVSTCVEERFKETASYIPALYITDGAYQTLPFPAAKTTRFPVHLWHALTSIFKGFTADQISVLPVRVCDS